MAMNAQKQPSKFIKPSVPTPSNLKHYKIGFIDELAPFMDVAIVLFFTKNTNDNSKFGDQLEKSLEKTLTRLYPLAGRFVEESQTIDCNDEGVEFIQAKVNIKLEDILGLEVNARSIKELLPLKTIPHDNVLTIQLTTFECGGVALGVSATHKVVDTSTLCTFVNEWAAMNREENDIKFTTPGFISSSLFPACGVRPILIPFITDEDLLSKYTLKKLSFSESDISNMKAKAITNARISKAINLREKMASPVPKNSCGNLWGFCSTVLETNQGLENLLNYSVKKTIDEYSKVHHDSEQGQMIVLNSILNVTNTPLSTNLILSTSWCKFPFYEADFGFGKPIWAVPWTTPMKNAMLLIDNAKGNGVDAYIFLEVKDAPYFKEGLDVNVF
ncbi:pelargonidin 3-O-(6-caffeoylglucoside) 5-O-(6-O-malonylglucoside) 4'''-malonyltransferase [Helianthus annuus]|uniref:pelargonidin 3-O-(6-caffeoylglucoside) 5-O-(6-O-malonylglucoside) 4'''-malonyltransferase n=1 Tax=Helianthus annuus TaxID=4232 RepID=UPI000B8EF457|nr:pelargonidin 3-O-(6-caffeoylglucoside) 5-O-(6-O-malonylglucoside) 4'''-malonyltransferase [Helianthus annuus]